MPPIFPDMNLNGTGYCAAFSFRMAARAVTRLFDAAMQTSGIRSTQFALLVAIAKKQPVPIHVLSEILFIDQTTLTRNLKLMQKEGLLSVSPRGEMRQRFVTLAAKGEQALARSLPLWREIQSRFVQSVGSKHWEGFREELERLSHLAVKLEEPDIRKGSKKSKSR